MKFYVYKLTQFLSFMKSWNDFLVIDASQTTFSEIFLQISNFFRFFGFGHCALLFRQAASVLQLTCPIQGLVVKFPNFFLTFRIRFD